MVFFVIFKLFQKYSIKEAEKQKEAELAEVLTEEQMTLLQEKKEEMCKARKGGKKIGNPT
jgi:hypothetical protein